MAEGATTLKGLRAQMGKNKILAVLLIFCRGCALLCCNDFVMFAGKSAANRVIWTRREAASNVSLVRLSAHNGRGKCDFLYKLLF